MEFLLKEGKELCIPAKSGENGFIFLLEGDAVIAGTRYEEKSAILFGEGDVVRVSAADKPARFVFAQGPRLREPVAWGGPIVMNTQQELQQAFADLRSGNFIK